MLKSLVAALFLFPLACNGSRDQILDSSTEYYYWDSDNSTKGLFPSVFNLATNAVISANATCGETGPEIYCKLVEHTFVREPQCGVCDSRRSSKRHPITNAIDGTNKWWQSPTLQNGKQFQWVTITLDLRQVYQIAYVILKAGISPRPGNWILERSLDGLAYKPWQYYAINDAECWEVYGIRPTLGKPRYRTDDEVICTSYYSKLNPLENGEIHTSLVSGRPGADEPTDVLREFTKARYIRLRLQKIRTLNADLMAINGNGPRRADKSVTRRYFYSIKDVSVGGQCTCFGHAKTCPIHQITGKLQCQCEHNTCGESCEICCPLYNQMPWRPGTNTDGAVCEECQCFGHADECYYDPTVAEKKLSLNIRGKYEGGGVCIKCKHHTEGINCEKCEDRYFRPRNVSHHSPSPCQECFCVGIGSTGMCVKDSSYLAEGMQPGDCICKEGFSGTKCDRCAVGYRNFPKCEPCPCNIAGIIDESTCEGECICKRNVEGKRCDSCKPGYFNLDADNPDGCYKCFCSGMTSICQSNSWGIEIISEMKGWRVTDYKGRIIVIPTIADDALKIETADIGRVDRFFWEAPSSYVGKKLYSYGGELRISISYRITHDVITGNFIGGPGVILQSGRRRIGYILRYQAEREKNNLIVPLHESQWVHLTTTGRIADNVTRKAFSIILNDITRLLVRANYHDDQVEGTLYNVEMEHASELSTSLRKMKTVEVCFCPPNYSGLSCEECDYGYRRVNNTLINGVCERCHCNNHSETCHPFTGECSNCLHHTTGSMCGFCESGYYGNALIGTADDCQRCQCPLPNIENNFSPTCLTTEGSNGSIDFVCTGCPRSYEGEKCERCSVGYFGTPLIVGGFCQPCDCSGNADTSNPKYCDLMTGKCLTCVNNTAGWNCEECEKGHYGDALLHRCYPCTCNEYGSKTLECDPATGHCYCKENYVGRNCDRCADGYGNVEGGCELCSCNRDGSLYSFCDPVSGQCPCKPGVFGRRCNTCLDGFYNFSSQGCQWCGCNQDGAKSQKCDEVNGQCICHPHVVTKTCSQCEEGYWNIISGKGCIDCECNVNGSFSNDCNNTHGQCSCKPGVGSRKCNKCLPGYFGFSEEGCKECPPCEQEGHVCDAVSGECVCPPFTVGERCEKCALLSWGHHPVRGCEPCDCNPETSVTEDCNPITGTCECFEGYEGRTCNKCHFAYYGFPDCRPCFCHPDGTDITMCTDSGDCHCDEEGYCPCKENVEGIKCKKCKKGTFGLTSHNRKGCFRCFCFGKTNECEDAKMVWSQVTGLSRQLTLEVGNTHLAKLHSLNVIPGRKGNVRLGVTGESHQPLYWMLPEEYLGDKVLAYNGFLQFRVTASSTLSSSDGFLSPYPLVLLQGNHRLVLIHSRYLPSHDGYYSVHIHEDEWQLLENPRLPVTRDILMVALQNVQHILIRATKNADAKSMRLDNVTLDVAVPVSSNLPSPYVAVGVEHCHCPKEYSGSSCQNPGFGYYRKRHPNFKDRKNVIDLVGWAEPCPCNNRSQVCNVDTGVCTNCTENTDGPHCELCAKGYFGEPSKGPCLKCACPLVTNSFSDICHRVEQDYVCDNCRVGYTGQHCERCSDGYYGNPSEEGGVCTPCDCNPFGSRNQICNQTTGQCACLRGISGRDCSFCEPRHILTGTGCFSCDTDCTRVLLDDVEFLTDMAEKHNISQFQPPPWVPLFKINREIISLQEKMNEYWEFINRGRLLCSNFTSGFDLETHFDLLYLRTRNLIRRSPPIAFSAQETREEADYIYAEVDTLWKNILAVTNELSMYGLKQEHQGFQVEDALEEGMSILEQLKSYNSAFDREKAEREFRKAVDLYQRARTMILNEPHLKEVNGRISDLEKFVQASISRIEKEIRVPIEETRNITSSLSVSLINFRDDVGMLRTKSQNVSATLKEAESRLEDAVNETSSTLQNMEDLSELNVVLQNSTVYLEHDHGINARLSPEYRQIYVIPAIEHARSLQANAQKLSNLFSATAELSRLPLKASGVYREIRDALIPAKENGKAALQTAEEAYNKVGGKERSLQREANESKLESERIHNSSVEVQEKVAELRFSSDEKNQNLNKVLDQLKQGRDMIQFLNKRLKDLPKDTEESLRNASRLHTVATKTSNRVIERLNKITVKIEEINPQVEKLKAVSGSGLQNLSLLIQQAKESLEKASRKSKVAKVLLERVKNKHNQVHPQLIELKNKVALARQKASTIDISLSVDKSSICTRSFQPDIEPGTRNSIILNYAIRSKLKESLLFFIASSTSEDFMAIEMIERKIRFLWNAGGGTKVITHNLTIETNDPQLLKEERWYRIEVNRVGNIAELRVQPVTDGKRDDPWKASGASPAGHVKMDLDASSHLFVGGLPKGHQAPRQLKAQSFVGCLYQLILDEKRVGLWNFLSNVGCDGCKEGITEQGDLNAFEFKGYGYAVLPQIRRYKGNAYYVTLKFKTLDENALLFLSPDNVTGNFVSLELREGYVLYQFDLGNTSRLTLRTLEKYNTGNWTRVVAQRSGLQGELSVENEIREGTLPLGGPTELHLKQSYMYFGGVPPTFPTNRWPSTTLQNFLGCMEELQIDTTALNLLKHEHYGVEDDCKDKGIYVVSFKGDGYVEMPSQPLRQVANFSFTFQSMQEDALLMLSTFEGFRTEYLTNKNARLPKDFSDKVQNYYSIALANGKIEARFGGNVKEIEITTNDTYNDGHYHTVMVLKKHRKIILKIDDKEVATARLPVDAQIIDAPETQGLFFGGVREEILLPVMVKIRDSFKGILKDAILNDKLINFRYPVNFEGVEIGHERKYHGEMRREFPNLMQPLERCAQMTSYATEKNSFRFGDIRHSYAQVPIKRKDFGWDFNITFEFRTYYPNGLIVFLKNGRRKSHFAIMLQGRRIVVDVQDRKHRRLTSQGFLNNGVWHNVTVSKIGRKMNLTVDSREPSKTKVRRKLSLRNPLFVGGVPEKTLSNKSLVMESFKGCIKNLKRNLKLIDVARGRVYGVSSCFTSIELGAYFGGDAYAVYDDEFNLGPTFDVQIQFKTTRPSGVILSLSEASGISFSLELDNGKVTATIDVGGTGPLRAIKEFDKYRMCDGEWHIIIVQYIPQEINLKVDKYDVVYGLGQNSLAPQVVTAAPLYIGGLPENGHRGVLHVQDNFVGCMKSVAINNRILDWIDMEYLHSIVPNSCPVF